MELKPCPKCGRKYYDYEAYITRSGEHCFRCLNCKFITCSVISSEAAARLWNAENEPHSATSVDSVEWDIDEWERQYNAMQERAVKAERKLKKAKAKARQYRAEADGWQSSANIEKRKAEMHMMLHEKLEERVGCNHGCLSSSIERLLERQTADAARIAQLEVDLEESQRARLALQEQVQGIEAELIVKEDARLAAKEKIEKLSEALNGLIRLCDSTLRRFFGEFDIRDRAVTESALGAARAALVGYEND